MPTTPLRRRSLTFTSEIPLTLLPQYRSSEHIALTILIPTRRDNIAFSRLRHRVTRHVFLLADGTHSEFDLARLLHTSLTTIHQSLGFLFCAHTIDIRIQRKETTMTLDPTMLETTLEFIAPQQQESKFFSTHYRERRKAFTDIFYSRLRSQSPEIDQLFSVRGTDMAEQGTKLFQTLWYIVGAVKRQDPALTKKVQELGLRHRRYGVQNWMYTVVGEVLLSAFADYLGDHWTPAMQESWATAYDLITGVIFST